MSVPDTRPSILIRLRDHSDREAWQEFEAVYRGVIRRMAKRFGLQDADAADLGQEVLIRVSNHIDRFEHQRTQARFRTWLGRLIRSAIVDQHRRRSRDRVEIQGCADSSGFDPPDEAAFRQTLADEYRKEVFHWAADRVRSEFTESSWQAFWRTAVHDEPVDQVARQMQRSAGAIYTSRSRVMKRIREEVCRFDEESLSQLDSLDSKESRLDRDAPLRRAIDGGQP
ncbi:MAG: sigma-70 family RNA polymerase sigma factor [Planctomycetota bacterium]